MFRRMLALPLLGALVSLTGCGPSTVQVKGQVKLDGNPLEGATVTYISEDGNNTFSGVTDASGNFTLQGKDKPGALPGTYKVLVVKSPKGSTSGERAEPGSADMSKMMEKMAKDQAKEGGVGKGGGPGGPVMSKGGDHIHSELPHKYASATSTPLTAKVPPESEPVVFDLQSDSKSGPGKSGPGGPGGPPGKK